MKSSVWDWSETPEENQQVVGFVLKETIHSFLLVSLMFVSGPGSSSTREFSVSTLARFFGESPLLADYKAIVAQCVVVVKAVKARGRWTRTEGQHWESLSATGLVDTII